MSLTEDSIKVGTLEWFYREAKSSSNDDRPSVLLLHGVPSQSYTWTVIMPTLAEKGFRAIAPDWIGSGFSAKPDKKEFAYTPDAFMSALAEFVRALELDRFSLVIQGFLGSVGIQYALRHPAEIDRLVILNAPVSPTAKLPWKLQQLGLPLLGNIFTQDPLLIDRTLEGGSRYRISDKDLDVYRRPFLKSSEAGRSLLATLQNLQLQSSMAEIASGLKNWQQPTLLVWGMKDPWLPFTQAQNLANSMPKAELIKLQDAAHYPQEHWSEKVSDAITSFLNREVI
ncbi:MAG: alpha/beta fold hydrolase [Cyanosarcina radialis HA8281-LM2]|nr:alpha/beta fold hydrolase [Cyanosarcina radialis HA8281-LM2]